MRRLLLYVFVGGIVIPVWDTVRPIAEAFIADELERIGVTPVAREA